MTPTVTLALILPALACTAGAPALVAVDLAPDLTRTIAVRVASLSTGQVIHADTLTTEDRAHIERSIAADAILERARRSVLTPTEQVLAARLGLPARTITGLPEVRR